MATLMALQAGLPAPDFRNMIGRGMTEYIKAIQAGMDSNYKPMKKIFAAVIRKTLRVQKLWIYDFRTSKDFTLKTNPLKREDLDEFIKCYNPKNRHERNPTWAKEMKDDSSAQNGSDASDAARWRAFD